MRLLLVGAFPFPHRQGSQVYFQEQARALRDAGADVELMTYASGSRDPDSMAFLGEFVHHTPPAWTAPASLRSGPSFAKPFADLALAMTLRHRIASISHDAMYDAVLTHNVEACLAGLLGLAGRAVPHVYCVHTLLGQELSTYSKSLKSMDLSDQSRGPGWLDRGLDRVGRGIDRQLARRVNGWIALSYTAQRVMRQFSTCPGELVAPMLPDPRREPTRLDPWETARRHGLAPESFFVYSGNLDGYQELETLGAAARLIGEAIQDPERRPILVVASHDPAGQARVAAMPGVEFRLVESVAEMQALLAAARATLLMRRIEGGYPIKLSNSHAAGTPAIAFHEREWGLRDGINCLIASAERPASSLASACLQLAADDDLAARLRMGARTLYQEQHRPDRAAVRTLALIERVCTETRAEPERARG